MEVVTDLDQFDPMQMQLLYYLAGRIREGLSKAGVGAGQLQEATHSLTFHVAAIIDGSTEMECDGKPLKPVLAFARDEGGSNLTSLEGGSYMHEYVSGVIDDIFESEDA